MRQRDKEKPNKTTPENTKHPTQEPGEEIYSLEDILAEYGTRRSTVRTAVPVNSPLDQPEGKVLAFPRPACPDASGGTGGFGCPGGTRDRFSAGPD